MNFTEPNERREQMKRLMLNNIFLAEVKSDDAKDTHFTQVLARHYHDACRIAKNVFTTRFVRVLPLED